MTVQFAPDGGPRQRGTEIGRLGAECVMVPPWVGPQPQAAPRAPRRPEAPRVKGAAHIPTPSPALTPADRGAHGVSRTAQRHWRPTPLRVAEPRIPLC